MTPRTIASVLVLSVAFGAFVAALLRVAEWVVELALVIGVLPVVFLVSAFVCFVVLMAVLWASR